MLVQDPQDLPFMRDQVSRKLHPDYQVDRLSVGRAKIEHAPGHGAAHDFRRRIPFERQGHDFGFIPGGNQCPTQTFDMRLGAARGEGNLCGTYENVANHWSSEVRDQKSEVRGTWFSDP